MFKVAASCWLLAVPISAITGVPGPRRSCADWGGISRDYGDFFQRLQDYGIGGVRERATAGAGFARTGAFSDLPTCPGLPWIVGFPHFSWGSTSLRVSLRREGFSFVFRLQPRTCSSVRARQGVVPGCFRRRLQRYNRLRCWYSTEYPKDAKLRSLTL